MFASFEIDRRVFLKGLASFAALLPNYKFAQFSPDGHFSNEDIPIARDLLLKMVNEERAARNLSLLQLDEFAARVGDKHATDMIEGKFISHWGRDGQTPYQRYSFAGGTDAVSENVSSQDGTLTMTRIAAISAITDMHQRMIDETPPNDGHRRTILNPHHTHVGFGLAVRDHSVRLDELYISRYAQIDQIPRHTAPGTKLTFSGRLLDRKYQLHNILVYYEQLPVAPDIEWLRQPRSYGLPESYTMVLPRLYGYSIYADGSQGSIDVRSNGKFRTSIQVDNKPGINTIVVWIRRSKKEPAFAVTHVCIRCE